MKTTKLFAALMLLVLMGCEKPDEQPQMTEYAIASFNEESVDFNTLYVYRSSIETMANQIKTTDKMLDIDFSKYTLLLVHGRTPGEISSIELNEDKDGSYTLRIKTQRWDLATFSDWHKAFLVSSTINKDNIRLDMVVK